MAHNVYIQGLSGAGFRVPDNTGALKKVKENVNVQVDLSDRKTQLILAGERDNFVRVAASNSTTVTVIGLTRYGFRIRDNGGTMVTVKLGSGVHTLDLTKPETRRILRRSFGRYAFTSSATALTIYGIQAKQNGFEVGDDTSAATIVLSDLTNTNVTAADEVVVGSKTYTFVSALTEARATATITSDGTAPADGDTVTINDVTYQFKTVLAAANDVLIGADSDAALQNLVYAVNQSGTVGTHYFAGTTAPTNVTAGAPSGSGAGATVLFTAAIGTGTAANAYASTETSAHLSFGGATFSGGVNPVANEVLVGADADTSLTYLSEAINGTVRGGEDWSSNTVANTDVTASAVSSHAITLTLVNDELPENVTTTTTASALSFGNWTNGLFKIYRGQSATVNPQKSPIYTRLRRHFKAWIEA